MSITECVAFCVAVIGMCCLCAFLGYHKLKNK